MVMKKTVKYFLIISLLASWACREEYLLDETPPAEDEAAFTYSPDEENDNIIHFSNSSNNFIKVWDLGNGSTVKGASATGVYPDSGTYVVKLTVYSAGGSTASTQEIYIAQSDPTLLDKPIFNMLTGGAGSPEGKTWVIDSAVAGHFGVGPNPSDAAQGDVPNYYAAAPNEKAGGGMYDDRYTFRLAGYDFTQQTNGDIYLNGGQAGDFPGAAESPVGDMTAPYTAPDNLTWTLSEPEGEYPVLTINSGGFIGYYTGVSTYQIVKLEENEMFLRYLDEAAPDLAWYLRLIPEGYESGGEEPEPEPEPENIALPLSFEEVEPVFNVFGGSSYTFVDNPDASGINTSETVLETVHGGETWAGLFVDLTNPLDVSMVNMISLKVWAPQTGTFRLKLENVDDSNDFVEIDQEVTVANAWEELKFDVSEVPSSVYARVVLFPGWDVSNAGTFYIDDISLAVESLAVTEETITGGSERTWKLMPASGSFGVGPVRGSDSYWPNGGDLSAERPCLFNDQFIFRSGGEYEYNAQGDLYAEPYMGVEAGCMDETALEGTDAEAWTSGVHSFSFTPATDTEPAYLSVTGTGAFIALPKAHNGGEYAAAPPPADATVTYEILSYIENLSGDILTLTVDVTEDGSAFWTFVLVAE